jgi:hypothetical protein
MDPSQQSTGLQAVLAYYKSKGVGPEQVTPDMIRQAVAANARAPGDVEANRVGLGADLGLGPVVPGLRNAGIEDANNGNTSAAPSGNVKIDPLQITSSPPRVPLPSTPEAGAAAPDPTSGSSLLQSLAPLLAGGGAAAFPLGRYILDKMRGGGVPGAAGIPGSVPMLPSPEARLMLTGPEQPPLITGPETQPRIGGPETAPQVVGPRVGAPQLPTPGEAPPIALPNQSTGRPPIPLPDGGVSPPLLPLLQTPGVDLQRPPASSISPAIDKAIQPPAVERAPVRGLPRGRPPIIRPPRL